MKSIQKILGVSFLLLVCGIAPIAAQTPAEQTTTRDVDNDGFDDWGLLGLLGLAGLLGRSRRDKVGVDTRRV